MALDKVRKLHREGSETSAEVSYSVDYWVRMTSREDGPRQVRSGFILATGINIGSPYSDGNDLDVRATVLSISERPVSSSHYLDWIVTVEYGIRLAEEEDPLFEPALIQIAYQNESKITYVNNAGLPLWNTAGDIIPMNKDDSSPTFTFQINQPTFNAPLAQTIRGVVNSTIWNIVSRGLSFPAYTMKLANTSANERRHKSTVYYETVYSFAFNQDTWIVPTPSKGFNKRKDPGEPIAWNNKKRIIDETTKLPVEEEVYLDEDGQPAATLAEVFIHQFHLYPEVNFNSIFGFLG